MIQNDDSQLPSTTGNESWHSAVFYWNSPAAENKLTEKCCGQEWLEVHRNFFWIYWCFSNICCLGEVVQSIVGIREIYIIFHFIGIYTDSRTLNMLLNKLTKNVLYSDVKVIYWSKIGKLDRSTWNLPQIVPLQSCLDRYNLKSECILEYNSAFLEKQD